MNTMLAHSIILLAVFSLIFGSIAAADFIERIPVNSEESFLTRLKEEAHRLEGAEVVVTLQADAGAPVLSIARDGEGYKISILISQFMLEGHGDVGNEEVCLDTFPVKVNGTRKVAFQQLIESEGIVEILNRAHCRFRMLSVGMRERDGGVISWAQSRIETTTVEQDLLNSLLSEIGPVAFNGAKGNKFISWGRSEN